MLSFFSHQKDMTEAAGKGVSSNAVGRLELQCQHRPATFRGTSQFVQQQLTLTISCVPKPRRFGQPYAIEKAYPSTTLFNRENTFEH